MKKNRNRRQQTPKPRMPGRNLEWAHAVLDQGARNNTVPSGKRYKRPAPGRRWE
jgi:hypothetical protein